MAVAVRMKRVGLLGGMSWESSIEYERMLNEGMRERYGGVASADLVVRSYNFAEIETYQSDGDWATVGARLASDAATLQRAGCELIALCTNTMHRVAPEIEAAVTVPFVHLADATAQAALALGVTTVGLLGTRYTMEHEFYRGRLEGLGLGVLIPDEPERTVVHDVIYQELVRGEINSASRAAYVAIAERLVERGAQAIVAGCTEIELLLTPGDLDVPLLATTRLHVDRILELAIGPPAGVPPDAERGPSLAPESAAPVSPTAVVRALLDRMQDRDWAGVAALVADDAVIDYPATSERFDGVGFVAMNRDYPEGWTIVVREVIADGERVAARIDVEHGDDVFHCNGWYEVRDGVIAKGTEYWVTAAGEAAPAWRQPYRL